MTAQRAEQISLGRAFAEALAAKDFGAVRALLVEPVDFLGLTPGRTWAAANSESVVHDVLMKWFEDGDHIDELAAVTEDTVGDRLRVGYRFHGHQADGPFVVEQQMYYAVDDDRISWMRVLCSGFRPHPS